MPHIKKSLNCLTFALWMWLRLDVRFTALLSELPMQYQRRDDAIRFETAVLARIDALGEKLHRALECDIRHCPVKDVFNCEVDHGERR